MKIFQLLEIKFYDWMIKGQILNKLSLKLKTIQLIQSMNSWSWRQLCGWRGLSRLRVGSRALAGFCRQSWWDWIFMKWSLFENKPAIACPQKQIQEAKGHRSIESTHKWPVTGLAKWTCLDQVLRASGLFNISQTFTPSWGWHQPQEGKACSHKQVYDRSTARLPVYILEAQVQDKCRSGVQKCKHTDTDKELCRGGEVSLQVQLRWCRLVTWWDGVWISRQPEGVTKNCSYILGHRLCTLNCEAGCPSVASSSSKGKDGKDPFYNTNESNGFLQWF